MNDHELQLQRFYAGLERRAPDQPDPCPSAHRPLPLQEQARQRELAKLGMQPLEKPPLTETMRTARRLAGLSETYQDSPPAVAVKGDGVFARSNYSTPPTDDGGGFYSSGHAPGALVPGYQRQQPQSPSPAPLPSPDPEVAAADRLQQALDVCREALRLRKPLYRAAVQFACDQAEFVADLSVNGWVPPDEVFIGAADVFSTLKDTLADSGELDLAQVAQVAAQLTAALSALRGEEQAEHTRPPVKRPMLLEQATPFQIFEVQEINHQGARLLKIRGTCIRGAEKNGNNRVYSPEILQREAAKLQAKIMAGESVFAHVDHPSDGVAKISETAAMWQNIEWDPKKKEIVGTAIVIPTSRGRDLRSVIESGGRVGISARGFGTTTRVEEGYESVNPDYSLSTFDFVVGASCPGAYAEAQ